MKRPTIARRSGRPSELQRLKPASRALRFGRAEARPSEGVLSKTRRSEGLLSKARFSESSLSKARLSEGLLALGIMSGASGDGTEVGLGCVPCRKHALEQ